MAKVFLSYDREDAGRARSIAEALEDAGHSVWWDRHIKGGSQFNKEIEEALNQAEAVVVLWSAHAVDSAWVRDEAAVARDSGRLVPAVIDNIKPPLGFRQFQTIDLTRWKRRSRSAAFQDLLGAISNLGITPTSALKSASLGATRSKLDRRWVAAALLVVIVMAAGYFAWTRLGPRAGIPTVAVAAVDPSSATRELTRDLLVKLGSLQSSQTQALRIVDSARQADFVFRVNAQRGSGTVGAGLDLLSSRDNAVLWSKDFVQPSGRRTDLQLQIAFTAGRVLQCALEPHAPGQPSLDQQTLKLYLNGCANLDESIAAGPLLGAGGARSAIPVFLAVLQKSPRFGPAWGKLLLAEASAAEPLYGSAFAEAQATLRSHITEARRLDPAIPEATVAEVELLPPSSFSQALRLLDRATQQNPNNPLLLSGRAAQLRSVGRMRESIDDARRAVELDPLSPSTRGSYVLALAFAGRIDAAKEELRQFELLWPATAALQEMQFRFNLRFGDPQKALQMARSLNIGGENQERFLIARVNPTKANIDRMISDARQDDTAYLGFMVQALGEFHRDDQMYQLLRSWPNREDIRSLGDVWFRPALKGLRRNPRFMKIASEAGLLAYWSQSGKWPDFCFEPDLTYDCKKEAARVAGATT